MEFPAYTDDAYWTDVIEQYIQNDNNHPGWYNIEFYMQEYFKDFYKGWGRDRRTSVSARRGIGIIFKK